MARTSEVYRALVTVDRVRDGRLPRRNPEREEIAVEEPTAVLHRQGVGQSATGRVARLAAAKVPRAMTSGGTRGYLKAVVDADTDRVLGASVLAAGVGEVMSVIRVAMRAGLPYTFAALEQAKPISDGCARPALRRHGRRNPVRSGGSPFPA